MAPIEPFLCRDVSYFMYLILMFLYIKYIVVHYILTMLSSMHKTDPYLLRYFGQLDDEIKTFAAQLIYRIDMPLGKLLYQMHMLYMYISELHKREAVLEFKRDA